MPTTITIPKSGMARFTKEAGEGLAGAADQVEEAFKWARRTDRPSRPERIDEELARFDAYRELYDAARAGVDQFLASRALRETLQGCLLEAGDDVKDATESRGTNGRGVVNSLEEARTR